MEAVFRDHVEQLHTSFEALLAMQPVKLERLPRLIPKSGVYLFSEGSAHLYVGRSKRMRDRLRYHCGSAIDAPFAFKLARYQTGHLKASYAASGSRKSLLADALFVEAFQAGKDRVRRMDIRFVGEPDPVRQALLEIYVTIVLRAPFNDFDTH